MNSISNISGKNQNSAFPIKEPVLVDKNFSKTIKSALHVINNLIHDSGETVKKMSKGEINDIQDMMIAAEKTSIGLELVVEVRNKLLESYCHTLGL